MAPIAEKVEDLIEPVRRDLSAFEQKVRELERKCAEFRRGVQGLSQDLTRACKSIAPEDVIADTEAGRADATDVGPAALAALAGITSRVEALGESGEGCTGQETFIIQQPGGSVIPVPCRLDRSLCASAFAPSSSADELAAGIRGLLADVPAAAYRERLGKPVDFVALYIPFEVSPEKLIDRLPGLVEEARAARVILAPPSALLAIMRSVAGAWLRFTCSGSVRSLVDKGQDLVDDLSAFISFFTENEKTLCEAVENYARASRSVDARSALPA